MRKNFTLFLLGKDDEKNFNCDFRSKELSQRKEKLLRREEHAFSDIATSSAYLVHVQLPIPLYPDPNGRSEILV
ncbi:unnamed protein product [Microthlaspi erraticum]|uniref:Uncharacterized protein n=1 Tax=Microthlaspi erraticum TaxID=1685480 RepID=A0A6D2I0I0_9BRAS|nr:unnamed protein product [Microthlaspi erraticum]